MKTNTILTALIAVFSLMSVSAQKLASKKVPEVLKKTMMATYPSVKKMKWYKEDANFEASFENNEVETSVVLDPSGKILETETELSMDQLPSAVKMYVEKNFAGQKISETAMIVDANGKKKYEVEIGKKDYLFDEAGNLLK